MSDLEKSEINFFDNLLNEIEVFNDLHEVSKKLESFLNVLRPRGERTTKLYEDVRGYANSLRRTQDALFLYIGDVTGFAEETLEGIESLNEENWEEFLEDTIEGIEGLSKRYDDSLEIYNKTQDILLRSKNMAEYLKEDMKTVGIAATVTELGPQAQAVCHILPNALSHLASWLCPVSSGAAVGYVVGKNVPFDNTYAKMGAGATAGMATTALCFWLVTLACPQLNACLSVGSAVSALLAFDYTSEMKEVVQCIDKVNNSITDHKATILALKKHVDRAVNQGDKLRNRRTGYEGNLNGLRRHLKPLKKALKDVQQKFGNNQ